MPMTITTLLETQKYNNKDFDIFEEVQNLINEEKNNIKEKTKEEEILFYNEILTNIETILLSGEFATIDLDNGEDKIIEADKVTITLTTSDNMKKSINFNMSKIYLDECESTLRSYYNISTNETLYIKKLDIVQPGMKIPKIEYDIYSKLNESKLNKLNISLCEYNKIFLSVPVEIEENLDIINSSSKYYKDLCYIINTDNDVDIILKDRQKEFIEGNKTVCQEDCDFYYYDYTTKNANCSCYVKQSSLKFENMTINITKLKENFGNIDNEMVTNLGITSCNILSSTENIKSNSGFYTLLIIIVIFIIVFIIFCVKGYNMIENKIDEVIYNQFKDEEKHKSKKIKNLITKEDGIIPAKKSKKTKIRKRGKKKPSSKSDTSKKEFINEINVKNNDINNILPINEVQKFPRAPKYKPDTDYEYNWLSYEDALKFDKRESCEYYCSLLRNKQLFIFTFCSFNDYNSGVVKKFMIFLSFALHYTVNALFFTESNIHKIYEDEGKFNFGYQLPYIIYSTIISTIILRAMLQILVLTDKDVLQVKLQITKGKALNMKEEKLKYVKIKFSVFFILNFILLILFWYYLTCFNAIYNNTQIYLIENTFISFGIALFYPFIINIIPMIMRNCSINSSNKNQRYLYKISQILQLI